eukprot:scaffold193320_cov21-Tisochrysis_lutea.AAC.3
MSGLYRPRVAHCIELSGAIARNQLMMSFSGVETHEWCLHMGIKACKVTTGFELQPGNLAAWPAEKKKEESVPAKRP